MHGFVACDDSADASGPIEQARKADGRGQQGGNSVQDMLRWRPLKTVGQRWSAAKHAVSFLSACVVVKVYRKNLCGRYKLVGYIFFLCQIISPPRDRPSLPPELPDVMRESSLGA